VTFANELRARGVAPLEAAVTAGYTRLRPIIMTACAMIIGMLRWHSARSSCRRS
jgi:multidrug efflux pump subunit AcrB